MTSRNAPDHYNEIDVDHAETRGMLWGFIIGACFGGAATGVAIAWHMGALL